MNPLHFLEGGGEMGERIRLFDWSGTALGPIEQWPQSLKTAVSTSLGCAFPIILWWGRELTVLYNDEYRPMFGAKHPWALGQPGACAWAAIWDVIGPMLSQVMERGEATRSRDLLLHIDRHGYPEEAYFSFSYSPIRVENGHIGGVFCPVIETTEKVIGERRLRTLRDLAAACRGVETERAIFQSAASVLAANAYDVPFAALYRIDESGQVAELESTAGIASGSPAASSRVPLPPDVGARRHGWSLGTVVGTGKPLIVTDLAAHFDDLPTGAWKSQAHSGIALPILLPGQVRPCAVLAAAVSPMRPLDTDYRTFFEFLATQIASGLADAKALEEERRRAEALAEIDRAKTAFFSNVSHEFRTPLTLILGPLEDALAETEEPGQRARLELLYRNARRLQKLVNTLLDFSRIEAGRLQASYEPTDLASLTAELASMFRSAVERAGMCLLVDCPPLTEPVYVDRDLYEKVVLNLLSNAFKFTLEGTITVTLRDAGTTVELSVTDTGTGIADEELPHIFERFHRIEGAPARTHEGTGIGLALVQELARLHGGSVGVRSVAGEGSTFAVTIPKGSAHLPSQRIGAAPQLATTALVAGHYLEEALRWLPDGVVAPTLGDSTPVVDVRRAEAAAGRRPRIVWADDNADMREYVSRLLGPGYDVEAVSDGAAALAAVRRRAPDLVLADVMMPRLDGFGLLRAVRADVQTRSIPVILLSARAGEESRVEGMEAGADDYLVKPFSARELLARVEAHLRMARLRGEGEQALRESEQHLTAANLQLAETGRRKDEFLAMLGHELRNPLGVIASAVQLIRARGLHDPVLEKALGAAQRQSAHMTRLVEELLDVARITEGKVTLKHEIVRLSQVIDAAVEAARPDVEAVGHRLYSSLPTEPLRLTGDSVRLVQVVVNLLNNAVKYTPPGGEIHLALERVGDEAVIRVRDTGQGMPQELLASVFDLFVQGTRGSDRAQGGLGIGLTLAKRLVEMHGGRILAASQGIGLGSEFTVMLPLLDERRPRADPSLRDEPVSSTTRRRILVVDDHPDGAEMLRLLLEHEGHDLEVAHDGATALALATSSRPEIVILDIGMPEMDGYEVARRLRQDPAMASVRLIALTGYGQEADTQRSHESGFDNHLVKPVNLEALRKVIG